MGSGLRYICCALILQTCNGWKGYSCGRWPSGEQPAGMVSQTSSCASDSQIRMVLTVDRAWSEVLTTFGAARTTSCFLSIGTGAAKATAIPTIGFSWSLLKIRTAFLDALSALTTNTEITNVLFRSLINNYSPQNGIKKYWRLNVGDGWVDLVKKNDSWVWESDSNTKPVDIALDDSGKKKEIADEAIAYMDAQGPIQLQKLKECAAALLAPDLEDNPASLPTPPPDKTFI